MIQKSDSIGELAKALCKVQQALKPAVKDAKNLHLKNKYADLSSVWDACRDALSKHGLSVIQLPAASDDGMIHLQTVLLHESGEWIASETCIPVVKGNGVNEAQAYGSCLTYARRYGLAAMVGITQEDTDGEVGEDAQRPPARAQDTKPAAPKPAEPLVWHQQQAKKLRYANLQAWCLERGVDYEGLLADRDAQKSVHDILISEVAAASKPLDEEAQ